MRAFVILLLVSAVIWGGMPFVHFTVDSNGGAAFADGGSSGGGSDDDDDDDDNSGGSGSGGSGSGSSGSGNSGSGSSGSGSSGSGGASASSGGAQSASSRVREPFGRDGITISFADGHVERISNGRFESLDRRGRIIESHAVERADVERLTSLGESAKRRGGSRGIQTVVEIAERGTSIEVTDSRGWREIVTRGAYIVKDPNGQTVARRPVTAADIIRIRDMLAFD